MSRLASRVAVVVVASLLVLSVVAVSVSGEDLGQSWTQAGTYSRPGIELQSCVVSNDFSRVYCMGGFDGTTYTNAALYAPFSASPGALGSWSTAKVYPLSAAGLSCAAFSTYIYCTGGYDGSARSKAVYYASPSSSGLGTWTAATSYPFKVELQSCFVYGTNLNCIGGFDGSKYYNSTRYATMSYSGGIGSWSNSTDYPTTVEGQSCAVYSGYVYCVGGYTGSKSIRLVYYAPISSSGLGKWSNTTEYPTRAYGESCATQANYIYCVGGSTSTGYTGGVYFAEILPSGGLGTWQSATPYPSNITLEDCQVSSGYLYCIGGFDGSSVSAGVYSNSIAPASQVTVTSTYTTTVTPSASATTTVYLGGNQTIAPTVTSTLTSTTSIYLVTTSTFTASSFAVKTSVVTSTYTQSTGTVTITSTSQPAQSSQLEELASVAAVGAVLGAAVGLVARRGARRKPRGQEQQAVQEEGGEEPPA